MSRNLSDTKPVIGSHEDIVAALVRSRQAARRLRTLSSLQRKDILLTAADTLWQMRTEITAANEIDRQSAVEMGLSKAMQDRLLLDEQRLKAVCDSVRYIAGLPDPVGKVVSGQLLENGINLEKVRVPLGVVATIYESRPNVSSDIAALCLKSGNAAVLRGGKEALHSNRAIVAAYHRALNHCQVDEGAVFFLDNPDRSLLPGFLKLNKLIDIIVPRGGEQLIRFVAENSTIPVIKHDKGVCTVFVDETAVLEKTIKVVLNSKVKRPSVCNAMENLVLHAGLPESFTSALLQALVDNGVTLHGDERARNTFKDLQPLGEEGYGTEYLDLACSVAVVDSHVDVYDFIERYSSGHSEAIMTEDYSRAEEFTRQVDSAALFINCSTYFHDGGQFGLGAEVGISTDKLHVRGPMGVEDLTTTKYIARGNGQTR